MNTGLEIFPFLIGRSYEIDYRVIVAPEFISKGMNISLLSTATGDINLTKEKYLLSRKIYPQSIDPFTIFFKVKKVKRKFNSEEKLSTVGGANEAIDR
jgi:hypothetical protein